MKNVAYACIAITAVFLIPSIWAQDAKIMILERSDTAKLKSAYQDFKKAQEAWEKTKLEVAKKYTTPDGCSGGVSATLLEVVKPGSCKVMEGWEKVDFSVDFRAVVPHKEFSHVTSMGWGVTPFNTTSTGYPALNSSGTITM